MTVNDLIDALQKLPYDIRTLEVYKGIAGNDYPIFKGTAYPVLVGDAEKVDRPGRFVLE